MFTPCTSAQEKPATKIDTPRYKDATLPVADRVADLLPRMTLEEKVDQLKWRLAAKCLGDRSDRHIYQRKSAEDPRQRNGVRRISSSLRAMLLSRAMVCNVSCARRRGSGIPVIFFGEGLHGYMEYGSTSFPQALGLASTWDPALVKRVFTAVGDEAGSRGSGQLFAPELDIARDPRWGRTEEGYGEDPYLVSRMGVAAIEGLQGDSFMIDRHHVLATAKHFAVHGQPEGGTNTAPGNISERVIRETFLVPFQAAVQEAHAGSVMASYNEIDGVPSHMNHWLLDKVLRQEWGFDGFSSPMAMLCRCW